ncbi:MAG: hypothetical protein FJ191_01125 [Gammaproteobacteria bacterium]|nr:hypothetical protein [Gammaproteobacteria bacterium]
MSIHQALFWLFVVSIPVIGLVVAVRLLWATCRAVRASRVKLAALLFLAAAGLVGLFAVVAGVWFGYAVAHTKKDFGSDLVVMLLTGLPFYGACYALWRMARRFESDLPA